MEMFGVAANVAAVDFQCAFARFSGELLPHRPQRIQHRGCIPRECRENRARREREHAGVPDIVAGGEIETRPLERRLFHEARRGEGVVRDGIAALDVAVAGLRMRGRDPERHQPSVAGQSGGNRHRVSERFLVPDKVIGGEHQHDRVGAVARLHEQGRQRNGGSRVAAERFEKVDRVTRLVGAQARVDVLGAEVVVAIGDGHEARHPGERRRAMRRLGEERLAVGQRHERLRRGLARKRPQAGSSTSGEDDGDHGGSFVVVH